MFVTNVAVRLGPMQNRRERPAKPALTRRGIVDIAVDVMRTDGMAKVTMRRLAKELDTGPASLYVYVRDTEELHAAMLDELLGEVDLRSDATDWRERLRAVITSYQRVLHDNPSLARVALVTRLSGPNYLAVVEAVLGCLAAGGMPRAQTAWAVDMLLLVATASAVEHGTRSENPAAATAEHSQLERVVAAAPADQYPNIAAHSEELLAGPVENRARWMFDVLLSGAFGTPIP